MATAMEMFEAFDKIDQAKGLYDSGSGIAEAVGARDEFIEACKEYERDPSPQNGEKVRDSYKDMYEKALDSVPGAYPIADEAANEAAKNLMDKLGGPGPLNQAKDFLDKANGRGSPLGSYEKNACAPWVEIGKDAVNNLAVRLDPLVLDLDGDGIELSGRAYFDIGADGFSENVEWVSVDDGILVLDRNGNGIIDDGAELFGEAVDFQGNPAADSFEALRSVDSNDDGVFDARDHRFNEVKIWRDLDQDGISDSNELLGLAELEISSINIFSAALANDPIGSASSIDRFGTFQYIDGASGIAASLRLDQNTIDSVPTIALPANEEIAEYLRHAGIGWIHPLEVAANQSDKLLGQLLDFEKINYQDRRSAIDSIVIEWGLTGAKSFDQNYVIANGPSKYNPDGTENQEYKDIVNKLLAFEGFSGTRVRSPNSDFPILIQSTGKDAFEVAHAGLSEQIYRSITSKYLAGKYLDLIESEILPEKIGFDFSVMAGKIQSEFSVSPNETFLELVDLLITNGDKLFSVGYDLASDLSGMYLSGQISASTLSYLENIGLWENNSLTYITAGSKTIILMGNSYVNDFSNAARIIGSEAGDVISTSGNADTKLFANQGDDVITFSYYSNNYISGGLGDDLIKADNIYVGRSEYRNTFEGGAGNDRFENGGAGDTYIYSIGDGHDTIVDFGHSPFTPGTDELVFGEGISKADIEVRRSENGLVLSMVAGGLVGSITLESWSDSKYRIETIRFHDGSTWSESELSALSLLGTEQNDTLILWEDDSWVNGLGGDDAIIGGGSNTTIFGGDGNDTINDGMGDDYILGGAGGDIITDEAGSDHIDGGDGDDIIIDAGSGVSTILGGGGADTITYSYYANYTVIGGSGDDIVKVENLNVGRHLYVNNFQGGLGSDRFEAGGASDTYYYSRGDGHDTILDYGYSPYKVGSDRVIFGKNVDGSASGASISAIDLWFRRVGSNLDVNIFGTMERITIEGWYSDSKKRIEQFVTSDGEILLKNQVQTLVDAMASFGVPLGGESTLTAAQLDQLNVVIAASWQ